MKSLSLLCSVSFLVLSVAGCSLIAKPYRPEKVDAPSQWQNIGPTEAAKVDAEWWKNFNLPEMTALIEQAKTDSFDIRAAVARIKQADAQARIAGSPLLPQIGLSTDISRNRTGSGRNGAIISGGGAVVTTGATTATTTSSSKGRIYNSTSTRLNASYEIDFWGRNASGETSAQAMAKASRFDEATVQLSTLSSIANMYLALVSLHERIELAKKNVEAAEALLSAIKLRAQNGLASALDLTQQENLVATQQTQLPALELQFTQNRNALAVLLGTNPQSLKLFVTAEAKPVETLPDETKTGEKPETAPAAAPIPVLDAVTVPEIIPGLPSQLLTRRPDVQYAEAQLQSAHADVNAARAAFFPSIVLTASGGYASPALSGLFQTDSLLWSIGASAAQTIFDNGALFGQFDFQKARYEELVQNYRKSVASSFADVEDALAGVKLLAEQETAQKEAVRTAELAYGYAQRQFHEGVVDITSVLNTQRALFTARGGYVQTRLARLQAVVELYQALGGGWHLSTPAVTETSSAKAAD